MPQKLPTMVSHIPVKNESKKVNRDAMQAAKHEADNKDAGKQKKKKNRQGSRQRNHKKIAVFFGGELFLLFETLRPGVREKAAPLCTSPEAAW